MNSLKYNKQSQVTGQDYYTDKTLQSLFAIPTTVSNKPADPLENYRTNHLCHQLQQFRQIQPPALSHWRQTLHQHQQFNPTLWKRIYSELVTNKVM